MMNVPNNDIISLLIMKNDYPPKELSTIRVGVPLYIGEYLRKTGLLESNNRASVLKSLLNIIILHDGILPLIDPYCEKEETYIYLSLSDAGLQFLSNRDSHGNNTRLSGNIQKVLHWQFLQCLYAFCLGDGYNGSGDFKPVYEKFCHAYGISSYPLDLARQQVKRFKQG